MSERECLYNLFFSFFFNTKWNVNNILIGAQNQKFQFNLKFEEAFVSSNFLLRNQNQNI